MLSTNGFVLTATEKFNMDLTVSLISCGCASVDAYKFKCPYTDHNNYEELYNLDELLKNVISLKKINILILGESSLEEAELGSLYNVKPFSFNLTDEEANQITVNILMEINKYLRTEQSSFQEYKSYSFPI